MHFSRTVCYISFMMLFGKTYAQMDLKFRGIEHASTVYDVWNINVSVQQNSIVYFQATVYSNKEGKVYEARSNIVQLVQGIHSLQSEMLQPFQDLFLLPGSNRQLKNDQYSFSIKAIAYPSNQQLAEYTSNFIFIEQNADTSKFLKKNVQFEGNASLNSQYSHAFSSDYTFQPTYVRFDAHPTLTLFDIPFSADVFVTTEQKNSVNTINNYVFKFDYNRFREKLVQKLLKETDQIIKNKVPDKYGYLKQLNIQQAPYYYKNRDALLKQMKDPETLKKMKALQKVEQYEQLVKNPEIKQKITKVDAFQKKYHLESIDDIQRQVEHLDKLHYDEITKWSKELHLDSVTQLKTVTSYLHYIDHAGSLKDSLYRSMLDFKKDSILLMKVYALANVDSTHHGDSSLRKVIYSSDKVLSKGMDPNTLREIKSLGKDSLKADKLIANLKRITQVNQTLDSVNKKLKVLGIDSAKLVALGKDLKRGVFKDLDSIFSGNANTLIHDFEKFTGISSLKESKRLLDLKGQYDQVLSESKAGLEDKLKLKTLSSKFDKIKSLDNIDVNSLARRESDFNSLLGKYNILTKKELFFKGIKRLELGTVYPQESSLGINGIVVKGYNIEVNPGKFYVSSFSGRADNYVLDTFSRPSSVHYKKAIVSLGVGYGDKNETHVHVFYIYSQERGKAAYDSLNHIFRMPVSNHILMSDIGGLFLHKLLYIGNEFSFSMINNAYASSEFSLRQQIRGFAQKTYITGLIPATNTKFKISLQYVGKNYMTLNTPFLLKDRIILDARLEQQLAKNKISVLANYKYDLDSLSQPKRLREAIHSLGVTIGVNVPKYPYLQISYIPVLISGSGLQPLENRLKYTGNVIVNVGYNFSIKKDKAFGLVQCTYANSMFNSAQYYYAGEGNVIVSYLKYTHQIIHTLNFIQSFSLPKNTGIRYTIQYTRPSYEDTLVYRTIATEISCSWGILKKSQNSFGVTYARGNQANKIGFYVQTTFPITKYVYLDMRLQKEQLSRDINDVRENIHGLTFKTQLRIKI